jgi:hypothetical protein
VDEFHEAAQNPATGYATMMIAKAIKEGWLRSRSGTVIGSRVAAAAASG